MLFKKMHARISSNLKKVIDAREQFKKVIHAREQFKKVKHAREHFLYTYFCSLYMKFYLRNNCKDLGKPNRRKQDPLVRARNDT